MEPTSTFVPAGPCDPTSCPVERAMSVLDGKWTMLIVRDLLSGRKRFGELKRSLAGISPKTLTDRLVQLADAGLVQRTMYAEIPPRVEYELTELGASAAPVLQSLAAWGSTLSDPARRS